ncbi:MAG: GntR family transcriptional regulator, partial [Bryobacteraceae bacterium]
MPALEALRAVSIRAPVAEAIRRALCEGQFSPGENINEAALASQFRVSRGPVREALLVLAEDGLVTHEQNRGFSALRVTPEDCAHISQVRLLLETHALELGRPRATAEDLRRLTALKVELLALFRSEEPPSRDEAEMAFHGYVLELSGNPWLAKSLRRVLITMSNIRPTSIT